MNQVKIGPLTHVGTDNKRYQRSPEVEAQITAALQLSSEKLQECIRIRDYTLPGYLKEECLVYLIRHFRKIGDDDLVGELFNQLAVSIRKQAHSQIKQFLHQAYVEDCYRDVVNAVICRLLNLQSDKDDFAQIRFRLWLKQLTFNTARPYFRRQEEEKTTFSLDTFTDSDKREKLYTARDDAPLPDRRLLGKESIQSLNFLSPDERNVFLLRYCAGWEVENQNPQVLTISKYFNVTPRTIRNWISRAQKKLDEQLGGKE